MVHILSESGIYFQMDSSVKIKSAEKGENVEVEKVRSSITLILNSLFNLNLQAETSAVRLLSLGKLLGSHL